MLKNKIKSLFWNDAYKRDASFSQFPQDLLKSIIKQLDLKTESRLLDVGSGRGELVHSLYEAGYTNILGIDISKEAIRIANDELKNKIKIFRLGEIEDVKDTKDVIFCKLVFAFIDDKKRFLKYSKSILSKGGKLLIYTPVLTKTNYPYIFKKNICIDKEGFNLIKEVFPNSKFKLVKKDQFGDMYIIICKK